MKKTARFMKLIAILTAAAIMLSLVPAYAVSAEEANESTSISAGSGQPATVAPDSVSTESTESTGDQWLVAPSAAILDEHTINLTFAEPIRINTPKPELLFAACEYANAKDTVGWLVRAKSAEIVEGNTVKLTFDIPITQNGYIRILGDVLSDSHEQVLAAYIDNLQGKYLYTDQFMKIGGTGNTSGTEIGVAFAA